ISIQRQFGVTTLYVTHDQDEALAMSDWIAVMDHGVVAQWGEPQEIYYRPRTAFVADFVGSVNLVRAQRGPGGAVVLAGTTLPLDLGSNGTDDVLLAIRPETLRLAPAEAPVGTGRLR